MPREVELKAVVEDVDACRRRLSAAGAHVTFEGRLEDRRYDSPDLRLRDADQMLRVRSYSDGHDSQGALEWKGPTRYEHGYKVREEISASTRDVASAASILERLGYAVTLEIDRDVVQYVLGDATIRFERYPSMDVLVEVEGSPAAIDRAIEALGMPRDAFSVDRLATFMARFEARTGRRAIVSERQAADAAGEDTANG
jgi:predicted adenylyl cyclase CyaB